MAIRIILIFLLNGCAFQKNCEVDLGVIKEQPYIVGKDSTNYLNALALELNLVKDLADDEWGIRFTIPSDSLHNLLTTRYIGVFEMGMDEV